MAAKMAVWVWLWLTRLDQVGKLLDTHHLTVVKRLNRRELKAGGSERKNCINNT